jgi:DNA-directed RNA polymerase specialized sigma24 family protein
MRSGDCHRNSCNAFLEHRAKKIERVVLCVLTNSKCIDAANHAPEVVNEICIKIKEAWLKLRSPEDAVNKIAKHTAITHTRTCGREVLREPDDSVCPCFVKQPVDPVAMYEKAILIKELYSQLKDPIDKAIFSLRFQDYKFKEIAALLDINENTVRSRYERAVKRLKLENSPPLLIFPDTEEPIY